MIHEERRFCRCVLNSAQVESALHLLRWWMRYLWISRQWCFLPCFCYVLLLFLLCFASLFGYHLAERLAVMWCEQEENRWEPWCSINSEYHAIAQKYDWQNNRLMRAHSPSPKRCKKMKGEVILVSWSCGINRVALLCVTTSQNCEKIGKKREKNPNYKRIYALHSPL